MPPAVPPAAPRHARRARQAFAPAPLRTATRARSHAAPVCSAAGAAGTPATGANARRLAKWLAADWGNREQAMENPTFWAHIHVCFRPLPWHLLDGYAMYCESAYDYNLGAPYKTSVVLIVHDGQGDLELASYKLEEPDEFWMGCYEPSLLESLERGRLMQLADACNTVYKWDQEKSAYVGYSRPGKECLIRRGGKEKETYLDSRIMLTADQYAAWDIGRDPETDEVVWGTPAGPFVFSPVTRLDHLVPEEPASVASSPA